MTYNGQLYVESTYSKQGNEYPRYPHGGVWNENGGWPSIELRLRLQAPSLDIPEEECAPLETEEYNREFASPAAGSDKVK